MFITSKDFLESLAGDVVVRFFLGGSDFQRVQINGLSGLYRNHWQEQAAVRLVYFRCAVYR